MYVYRCVYAKLSTATHLKACNATGTCVGAVLPQTRGGAWNRLEFEHDHLHIEAHDLNTHHTVPPKRLAWNITTSLMLSLSAHHYEH